MLGASFESVLARAQFGDEGAFEALWRDLDGSLVGYLRSLCGDAAEDVAAETWVTVVRGLGRFRGDEAGWRAWVFTTARRRAVDELRARARRPQPAGSGADLVRDDAPDGRDVADDFLAGEQARSTLAEIHRLPPHQAEPVALRVFAGLSVEQIAELLGRSSGAVRVAVHRGLRTLAESTAFNRPGP